MESTLAEDISRASLISSSTPWCSTLPEGAANGDCTDFKGLLTGLIGFDVGDKVEGMLGGHKLGDIVGAMKGDINGSSPKDFMQLVNVQ